VSQSGHKMALWRARRHGVTGFVSQPQPKALGEPSRGQQILAGTLFFAGELVSLQDGQSIWDIRSPSADFRAALHGFAWLDDLAALGTSEAMQAAQRWTIDWITRQRKQKTQAWAPWLVGRRQMRWITHGVTLMNGMDGDATRSFIDMMGQQAHYLSATWQKTTPGFARFEALAGYIHSASALSGMERHLPRALQMLAGALGRDIDAQGGIPSRNPEELLEIFALLTWTTDVLRDAGRHTDPSLDAAIARIAPVLRSLRHADGTLARFQGGGRGRPGLLDLALRQSRLRPALAKGQAMGYARLAAGSVTVIADAAPPLLGRGSGRAHASSLALQVTSGRNPILVSAGAGVRFGRDWRRAGRASPSHSTLVLEGYSSARLERGGEGLVDGPVNMGFAASVAGRAESISMTHDGWRKSHGLTHLRDLALENDGRLLRGEDSLAALEPQDRELLDRVLRYAPEHALSYKVHFHLHPDIRASLDMNGQAISLELPGGEVWVFRATVPGVPRGAPLVLAPSVYLDTRHLKPRATKQIVLSGQLTSYGSAIDWSLACPAGAPRRRRKPAPMLL